MTADLDRRLTALADAVGVAAGRLDPDAVEAAHRVTGKAGARLGLGVEATVVALAGPTGAGKSLLFNALTGADLAAVGRRRPTTSVGQAAVWGAGSDALLDWLEIGRRHRVESDRLSGLVLLDLPDFDSVETAHRLEVNRIVELADLIVWVVEPQKYADAALHEGYLRPLASHGGSMAVVLNQADVLAPTEADALRRDTVRLLAEDGLAGMPVLAVSAQTGAGLDELRELVAQRVASREAAVARLAADVAAAAASLRRWCGSPRPTLVESRDREALVAALSEAAGVPRVVEAVGAAHRHRGALSSGWPPVRWVRRLKPDPLRRLRLDEGHERGVGRTSLPPATDVQLAQVATAVRAVADSASEGLPAPWPTLVRRAASKDEDRVGDRLDLAVRSPRLDTGPPRWWRLASLLQWLLAATAVAGLAWIALAGVAGYVRIEDVVPRPDVAGAPIPTWLVLGGLALGLGLSFLTRLVNSAGARRRQRAAERALRPAVESVADELVLGPVQRELGAHETLRQALAVAAGERTLLATGATRRVGPRAASRRAAS